MIRFNNLFGNMFYLKDIVRVLSFLAIFYGFADASPTEPRVSKYNVVVSQKFKSEIQAENLGFIEDFFKISDMNIHSWFSFADPAPVLQIQSHQGAPSMNDDQRDLVGFTASMTKASAEMLESYSEVIMIEEDGIVYASELNTAPGDKPSPKDILFQHNATWGLQRISQREKLLIGGKKNDYVYRHLKDAGHDVDVYVIDTGIRVTHEEFGKRAFWGFTAPQGDRDVDANGHGTHVAATIAGEKYGVAKNAHVHAVKVLGSDGSGSTSDVIKGIEFVMNAHLSRRDKRKSVANMSLGGSKSVILDWAVRRAISSGVHFAVAAGNSFQDACRSSPAAVDEAVTVGATDIRDKMAFFSNYGSCVDIFAPGVDIESAWNSGDKDSRRISGTSMASPHIAGVMAAIVSNDPSLNPAQMKKLLLESGTRKILRGIPYETSNIMVYLGVE